VAGLWVSNDILSKLKPAGLALCSHLSPSCSGVAVIAQSRQSNLFRMDGRQAGKRFVAVVARPAANEKAFGGRI
jgi:hypothetical protein